MRNLALLLSTLLVCTVFVNAQADCGVVDRMMYPVDVNTFLLGQDFNAASPRHQGRFHTGEDWYGGDVGLPVRAAARGRVMYAYELGWGRDGGVIIIEHTFPDDTRAYTQYGHLAQTDTLEFPDALTCVEAGEIIGVIGDARPAPHLHFEVRIANPYTPGPGYTRAAPYEEAYRDPAKFIMNQQTWLTDAHQWHIMTGSGSTLAERGPVAPPLMLNDESLLYLDNTTIRRATSDGRVLWRIRLEKEAVAITALQGAALLTFADGTMQYVNPDGTLGDNWRVPDVTFSGAPFAAYDWLIFPAPDNELIAIDAARRNIVWRVANIPPVLRWHLAGSPTNFVIGLVTATDELIKLAGSGIVIERAQLRESAALDTAEDGQTLLAFTHGGLWQLGVDGTWTLALDETPRGGDSSAVLRTDDGRTLLYDSTTLHAYSRDADLLWQAGILNVSGAVKLTPYDDITLLTSTGGNIAAINRNGIVCNQTRIYGNDAARQWHNLGDDGILRVAIADQILGLDWATFTGGCG